MESSAIQTESFIYFCYIRKANDFLSVDFEIQASVHLECYEMSAFLQHLLFMLLISHFIILPYSLAMSVFSFDGFHVTRALAVRAIQMRL